MKNYKQIYAIEKKNIQRIIDTLEQQNDYKTISLLKGGVIGIYWFYREENGIKYAYIGKSRDKGGMLARMAKHLSTFQRFDVSLKAHGLFHKDKNPNGYKCGILLVCNKEIQDEKENEFVIYYANKGYQLRNQESGGTIGKTILGERKQPKTYSEGKKIGYDKAREEIAVIFTKYLKAETINNNKISIKKLDEFNKMVEENGKG